MGKVLIISALWEPSVNRVIKALDHRGIEWIRFNTETFPLLSSGILRFSSKECSAEMVQNKIGFNPSELTAVWNRRFSDFILPKGLSDREMEFTKSECLAFFNSFLDFAQCKWVNDREAERSASRKPFQLQAALAAGLRIPKTLITNDPAQVLAFRDECEGQIAFKPLSGVSSRALDYSKEAADLFAGQFSLEPAIKESSTESTIPLIFTQILDDSKIPYLSNLAASPAIFQEYVEKSSELRVTIVGSQVFAARIYSQEANITKTDFRRFSLPGNPKIRHELCKLPDELVRRLLQLMNALNLVFGCIDMIETPEGDYVFLEVNPSGQWGWIEDYTGAPISQALAGMLGNF